MKGRMPTTVSELSHRTMRSAIRFITEHVSPELAKKVAGLMTHIDELGERAPDRPIADCDPIRARDAMKVVLFECVRMAECAEALCPRATTQVAIRIRDIKDEHGPAAGSTFQLTVKASDEAPLETIAEAIVETIPDKDADLVAAVTVMMATDKQDIESYFFDGLWGGNVAFTFWRHVHRIFDLDVQVVKVNVVLKNKGEEEEDGEQDEREPEDADEAEHGEHEVRKHGEKAHDEENDGADKGRGHEGGGDEDVDVTHLAARGYVPVQAGSEYNDEPSEDTDGAADGAGSAGGAGGDSDDGGDEAEGQRSKQAAASQSPPPKKQGGRGKTKNRYLMDGTTEALVRYREHIIKGDIGLAGLVRTDGLRLCMMRSCKNEVEPGVHSSFWRNFCASCSSARGFCSQCGLLNDRRNSMSCIIGTKGCNPRAPINKGLAQRQILDRILTDFKEKNPEDAPPSASR